MVILPAQLVVAAQPGVGSLHDPAHWLDFEAPLTGQSFHKLQFAHSVIGHSRAQRAPIGLVRPHLLQGDDAGSGRLEHSPRPCSVVQSRRVNDCGHQQAQGIGEQMALAPKHLFAASKAAFWSARNAALGALGVNHPAGWLTVIAALDLALNPSAQRVVDRRPDAFDGPLLNIVVDRALGRERTIAAATPAGSRFSACRASCCARPAGRSAAWVGSLPVPRHRGGVAPTGHRSGRSRMVQPGQSARSVLLSFYPSLGYDWSFSNISLPLRGAFCLARTR